MCDCYLGGMEGVVDRQSFLSFSKLRWHKGWEEEVFEKVWEEKRWEGKKGFGPFLYLNFGAFRKR